MLEHLVPAPRAARVQYPVPARGAARALRLRAYTRRASGVRAYARGTGTQCDTRKRAGGS